MTKEIKKKKSKGKLVQYLLDHLILPIIVGVILFIIGFIFFRNDTDSSLEDSDFEKIIGSTGQENQNIFNLPTTYDLCSVSSDTSKLQPILDSTLNIQIISNHLYVGGKNRDSLEYAARTANGEDIYVGYRDADGVMNFELEKLPHIELEYLDKFYTLRTMHVADDLCIVTLSRIFKNTMELDTFPTYSKKYVLPK